MAELYFYYGCMGSSKTAQALMMKYNYEQQGKKVMLLKPSVDTRTPPDLVQSRIGLRSKAISVKKNDNIKDICLMNPGRNSRDFSHGMDRPLIFIGFVFCLIVSLVADVFFDYIFAHIAQCTHVVTGRPQMPAPIL